MSNFKNSFEQFKNDPEKWRQDSWDKMSDSKVKFFNILIKLSCSILVILCLLLGFVKDKNYFILGFIALIVLVKYDPMHLKNKYGSKNK